MALIGQKLILSNHSHALTSVREPYVYLRGEPGLIGNERFRGYHVDLLRHLAEEAGLDYQLQLAAADHVGGIDEDGLWDGLLGYLESGRADMALAPITMTAQRAEKFYFTSDVGILDLALVRCRYCREMTPQPTRHRHRQRSPMEIALSMPDRNAKMAPELMLGAVRDGEALAALTLEEDRETLLQRLRTEGVTVGSIAEGLDRVRQGELQLLLDNETAIFYTNQDPCDLTVTHQLGMNFPYAFAMPMENQFQEQVNRALRALKVDQPLWNSLRNTWFSDECGGDGSNSDTDASAAATDAGETDTVAVPHLKITTMMVAPFVLPPSSATKHLRGYIPDLVRRMAAEMPFTFDLSLVRDRRGEGERRAGGQWTGMTGELLRGDADVAAAPFVVRRRHHRVLSFTKPFLHSSMSLLLQAPQSGDDVSLLFLEDLANQSDVTIGVVAGSHTYRQLRSSKDGIEAEIWRQISRDRKHTVVASIDEGVARVRRGNFALILQSTESAYFASQEPCDLMSMDQFLSIIHYMFAVKKNSPLGDQLNVALVALQEAGVLQQLYHRWWNGDECSGPGDLDLVDLDGSRDVFNRTMPTVVTERISRDETTPLRRPAGYTIHPIVEEVDIFPPVIVADTLTTDDTAHQEQESSDLGVTQLESSNRMTGNNETTRDIHGGTQDSGAATEMNEFRDEDTTQGGILTELLFTTAEDYGESEFTQEPGPANIWVDTDYDANQHRPTMEPESDPLIATTESGIADTPPSPVEESPLEGNRFVPTIDYDLEFYLPHGALDHDFEDYMDNYNIEDWQNNYVTPDFNDFGVPVFGEDTEEENADGSRVEDSTFFPPPPLSPTVPTTLRMASPIDSLNDRQITDINDATHSDTITVIPLVTEISTSLIESTTPPVSVTEDTALTTRRSRSRKRKGRNRNRKRKGKTNSVTTDENVQTERPRRRHRQNNHRRRHRMHTQMSRGTTEQYRQRHTVAIGDNLRHPIMEDGAYEGAILEFPRIDSDFEHLYDRYRDIDRHREGDLPTEYLTTPDDGLLWDVTFANNSYSYEPLENCACVSISPVPVLSLVFCLSLISIS